VPARPWFGCPLRQPPSVSDGGVASCGAGRAPQFCRPSSSGLVGAPRGSVGCPGRQWRARAQPPPGPPAALLALHGWERGRCGGCRDPDEGLGWGQETPLGRQRAGSSRGAALLPLGSIGVLEAHPVSGLPAAPAHDGVNKLVDEAPRVPAQGGLQQLHHSLLIRAEAAQAGYDEALRCCCFLGTLEEPPQLLTQPEQQWMEDSGVRAEDGGPDVRAEAAHWSHGQHPRSWWPARCGAMEAVGSWLCGTSSCPMGDDDCWCCRWWDDMLLKVVVHPHGVQDGSHPPLAEGALGLDLSPVRDAWVAELVEAWHHVVGLLPAAQADRTAVLRLRGHALHVLRWAAGDGDVDPFPLAGPAAAVDVALEKAERPQPLAGAGRGGRNVQVPQEGNPPSCPGPGFPAQITSAAASVSPGCPGCLNLAGPGRILVWLWGRAGGVAVKNSPSMTSAPATASLNTPTSRTCSAGVWGRAARVRLSTRVEAERDMWSQSVA